MPPKLADAETTPAPAPEPAADKKAAAEERKAKKREAEDRAVKPGLLSPLPEPLIKDCQRVRHLEEWWPPPGPCRFPPPDTFSVMATDAKGNRFLLLDMKAEGGPAVAVLPGRRAGQIARDVKKKGAIDRTRWRATFPAFNSAADVERFQAVLAARPPKQEDDD